MTICVFQRLYTTYGKYMVRDTIYIMGIIECHQRIIRMIPNTNNK